MLAALTNPKKRRPTRIIFLVVLVTVVAVGWHTLKREDDFFTRISDPSAWTASASPDALAASTDISTFESTSDTLPSVLATGPTDPHEKPDFAGRPVAFIMELDPAAAPNILTVMLHFATVLGPTWPVVLVTLERNWRMPRSRPFQRLLRQGRFRVLYLPPGTAITNHHSVSVFLTSPWLWEQFETADRVLIFQPDGIICSNSPQSVEDFLEWDMIGAPISHPHGAGYNGGLTMRNPRLMLDIARDPDLVLGPEDAEDQWFYERAKERGAHLPSYDVAKKFSVESIYYDKPLGYHQPSRWQINNIDKILKWCPEVGMLQNGRFA